MTTSFSGATSAPPASGLREVAGAARTLLAGSARHLRDRMYATGGRGGGNDGPPDLDELWRDFNRKLTGLFGNKRPGRVDGPGPAGPGGGGGGPNFPTDMRSAGIGAGLIAGVVLLIWLGSGFFIVQEGQQAVITSFGRYSQTVGAGFGWHLPYPFQAHETVAVTQLRSVEVGATPSGRRPACATRRCSPRTRTSSTSTSPCSTA